MELTFAHYRNRFCMFRTYYALAKGLVRLDGLDISVVEVPDPPSHAQEEALIRGEAHVANLYLLNFLRRRAEGAPIVAFVPSGRLLARETVCLYWRMGPSRSLVT